MSWNDERIHQLKKLWKEGVTTSEIGRKLGISKNAVVGKAHRLQLDARPSPIKKIVAMAKSPLVVSKQPLQMGTKATPQIPMATVKVPLRSEIGKNSVVSAVSAVKIDNIKKNNKEETGALSTGKKKQISLSDLGVSTCRWPTGDPKEPGFHFCGKKTIEGKPYCDEHSALAFVGVGGARAKGMGRGRKKKVQT